MDINLFRDIIVIFALSIAVILLCHRLRLPTIVGFLLTGVICGPHGLGLVSGIAQVGSLSTLGVVLLLFTVGLEFSIKKLLKYKKFFFVGGSIQVFLTGLIGFCVAKLLGRPAGESVFLGFLLSLSSTAISIRVLDQRSETETPHGRVSLGILIFQDVLAVPMMLVTPILAGNQQGMDISFLWLFAKGIVMLVIVFFAAERIVPKILYYIAKTGSRELFVLGVLTICFSVAWVSSLAGLSLALGAFLAGLIISDSEYSNQAVSDVLPFQEIFISFFFVSIGMLLDLGFFFEHPLLILAIAAAVMVMKAFVGFITTLSVGMPIRTAVLTGIALCQIGEFSFVLAKAGMENHIATTYYFELFLAVSLVSMALTPSLMEIAPYIANACMVLPFPAKLKAGFDFISDNERPLYKDHVIIIGYGFSGKNLARSLKEAEIPYIILDMDPDTVKIEKQKGEPIYFGDAVHDSVLRHANIKEARAVAVLINDPVASMRIVEKSKRLNPKSYLIVRTRFLIEMQPMYSLGADDVIPDEFGSSVEIFTRVLREYNKPHEFIEKIINDVRSEGYEMLRLLYKEPEAVSGYRGSSNITIETHRLHPDSPLVGKTLQESSLRKDYGITVALIKRDHETLLNLDANSILKQNDRLVLLGSRESLKRALHLFTKSAKE